MNENEQNPLEPQEPMGKHSMPRMTTENFTERPDQASGFSYKVPEGAVADFAAQSEPDSADDATAGAPHVSVVDAAPEAEPDAPAQSKPKTVLRGIDIVFGLVAVIAIAVAVWSFVSFGQPSGAAAKVDDTVITEQEVTDYINTYRSNYGMSDDSTWAYALMQQSLTPNSYRNTVINSMVSTKIIEREADKLGVTVSDDDITAAIEEIKTNMGITDDETWQSTLSQYGTTEDELREQERDSVLEQNLYEAAVPKPDGYDDAKAAAEAVETDDDGNAKNDDDQTTLDNYSDLKSQWQEDCSIYLSKLKAAAKITIYPMPDDVSYNVDMSLAASTSTSDDSSTEETSTDESTDESSTEETSTDETSTDESSADDSSTDDSSSEESSESTN